jgi:hypothetical protein
MKLYDLAKMTTATTGTGAITLVAAVAPFLTFDQAGVLDQDTVSYAIFDPPNTEVGFGVYTTSTKNLTRTVKRSTGAGNTAAISLSGSAMVFISALAEDFYNIAQPNILINPFMEIDQANEGASVTLTSSNTYIVDQWQTTLNSASAVATAQRVADGPLTFPNSLKITVSTGASVGSSEYLFVNQPIEANNLTEIALGTASAQTLALTFWVKSSIGSYTMCGSLRNAAGTRSYPFNVSITSSATWEKKTVIIPGDVTGTWVTTGTAKGMSVCLTAAVGSTFQGTANTWAASNLLGTSSCTNTILTTNGATFQLTGVKLEVSPVPTPYGRRNFTDEVVRCQRYYNKTYDLGTAPGTNVGADGTIRPIFIGWSTGTGTFLYPHRFPVTMRATPTFTFYSNTGVTGNVSTFTGTPPWVHTSSFGTSSVAFTTGILVDLSIASNIFVIYDLVADARL